METQRRGGGSGCQDTACCRRERRQGHTALTGPVGKTEPETVFHTECCWRRVWGRGKAPRGWRRGADGSSRRGPSCSRSGDLGGAQALHGSHGATAAGTSGEIKPGPRCRGKGEGGSSRGKKRQVTGEKTELRGREARPAGGASGRLAASTSHRANTFPLGGRGGARRGHLWPPASTPCRIQPEKGNQTRPKHKGEAGLQVRCPLGKASPAFSCRAGES